MYYRSVRQKIVMLLGAISCLVIVAFSGLLGVLLWQMTESLYGRQAELVISLQRTVDQNGQVMSTMLNDYTLWDEMYTFAERVDSVYGVAGDKAIPEPDLLWAKDNIGTVLSAASKIDYVWVLNRSGDCIFQAQDDERDDRLFAPPFAAFAFNDVESKKGLHGFLRLDSGALLELRAMQIMHTSDLQRTGEFSGWLVFAREIDEDVITRLSETLGDQVSLQNSGWSAPRKHKLGAWQVEAGYALPAIAGQPPAGTLVIRKDFHDFYQLFLMFMGIYGLALVAVVLMLAMVYWCMGRWIISPLQAFSDALNSKSVEPLFKYIETHNEMGRLAHLIIEFFRQRQMLETEVNAKEQVVDSLSQANRELYESAHRDGLTGLSNRRCYDEYLLAVWERATLAHGMVAIILFDVDDFKRYNDTYGHPQGDACLKKLADIAQTVVQREGDLLARYGGEEFVVVLPNTSEDGAFALAQRIHDAIGDAHIPHQTSRAAPCVTVSMGVAALKANRTRNREVLLAKADLALYQAKANGRNRVEKASLLHPGQTVVDFKQPRRS